MSVSLNDDGYRSGTSRLVAAALAAAEGSVTVAELVEKTGLARTTVSRSLTVLEAGGRAVRVPGRRHGAGRDPDQWSPTGKPGSADTAPPPVPSSPGADVPSPGSRSEIDGAPVWRAQGRVTSTGSRLAPGGLRELVVACLGRDRTRAWSAGEIARVVGRSAGAVTNVFDLLIATGVAEQAGTGRPRRVHLR
ncbi:helix-turn-helix domain-containing protein [Frankia sp. CcI49]|uniref:MarR family transcriptional regulator n=1 Tax=Frankia sp. CcI49 TaxID=1745382 RepID=UPI0013046936|nr:helix-turn-helix domain-containing protein [Frankia sp. CcI49]